MVGSGRATHRGLGEAHGARSRKETMANEANDLPVLVTGATGKQGGAVAASLFARKVPVRALVRDETTAAARSLRERGAELVVGDFFDPASLRRAAEGTRAVFSVQHPDLADLENDAERVKGKNLIDAARAAGVPQLVHTSTSGTGAHHRSAPGWETERGAARNYWESKAYLEDAVERAGFTHWTIVKPCFFMENFVRPSMMFHGGTSDRLLTTILPDTVLPIVAVQDIGEAVAEAIVDPPRFHRVALELASERLTMRAIAAALSEALKKPVVVPSLTPDEAIAQGLHPMFARPHARLNVHGSPAVPETARALGVRLTTFAEWLRTHPI